jgi:PPOX class probable F420-dependent enzyme
MRALAVGSGASRSEAPGTVPHDGAGPAGRHSPRTSYGVSVDEQEMRRRFAGARVARLATVAPDGRPHVVPCCFVLAHATDAQARDIVYSAVDAKPKSTLALRRLANLRHEPRAALLVDHYADDWSTLWWIRVDGDGRVLDADAERDGPEHDAAIAQLGAKYPVYVTDRPPGAVIALDVTAWRAWP